MNEANHLALANKNHEALQHLIGSPEKYSEWIATVAYYKAIQVVEAVLVSRGKQSSSHTKRLETIKKLGLPQLHGHLRAMWSASCIARYLYDHDAGAHYKSFADYLRPERVIDSLVTRRLKPIEAFCVPMLPKPFQDMLERM